MVIDWLALGLACALLALLYAFGLHSTRGERMTAPQPQHRIDRGARNDGEIHALLDQARTGTAQPASGTSFHDGVRAAIEYLHGGRHPYQQAAPNPAAALPPRDAAVDAQVGNQPGGKTPPDQPPAPAAAPSGTGAAGAGAPGGTGTTTAPTTR